MNDRLPPPGSSATVASGPAPGRREKRDAPRASRTAEPAPRGRPRPQTPSQPRPAGRLASSTRRTDWFWASIGPRPTASSAARPETQWRPCETRMLSSTFTKLEDVPGSNEPPRPQPWQPLAGTQTSVVPVSSRHCTVCGGLPIDSSATGPPPDCGHSSGVQPPPPTCWGPPPILASSPPPPPGPEVSCSSTKSLKSEISGGPM
mmetsp:Transcript_87159/g.246834  ORF Transcript_87159/g.246834 Transcript_87159/m.246834 type:complete len:204 (-) Transcript_87159:337-948(-)